MKRMILAAWIAAMTAVCAFGAGANGEGDGGGKAAHDPFVPSDRLIAAIRTHETLDGELSGNTLQIRPIYVRDVNRIYGTAYSMKDVYDRHKSQVIARLYLSYWGRRYFERTGKMPTDEVFARMHNGGGEKGWRKWATKGYWERVREVLVGSGS